MNFCHVLPTVVITASNASFTVQFSQSTISRSSSESGSAWAFGKSSVAVLAASTSRRAASTHSAMSACLLLGAHD